MRFGLIWSDFIIGSCDFRVMKMAIVHDLAESIVGDITPFCGVSKEEKYKREEVSCAYIPVQNIHLNATILHSMHCYDHDLNGF